MTLTTTTRPQFTRGDRLRKARELTGLDRKAFADLLGIHRDTITSYENDGSPKLPVLESWAAKTNVDLEWLRWGEEGQPSDYRVDVLPLPVKPSRPGTRNDSRGPRGRIK